nr:hypothetical protein [Endozoicomonas sp.]
MRTMASRTMASIEESVPFRLDAYLCKLEKMKRWALEAIESTDDEAEKKHLTDIAHCYAFAIEQTLTYVTGEPNGT